VKTKKGKIRNIVWEITKLIIPAFVGFLFAYVTFSKEYDATEKDRLNNSLNKILDINLQYPFVEDSVFIAHWNLNKDSNSDSSLRYQTYCEYVFNFLQDACGYYKYNKKKIAAFIDLSDLILQHKEWWDLPEQQLSDAYPKEFKQFINEAYQHQKN